MDLSPLLRAYLEVVDVEGPQGVAVANARPSAEDVKLPIRRINEAGMSEGLRWLTITWSDVARWEDDGPFLQRDAKNPHIIVRGARVFEAPVHQQSFSGRIVAHS